MIPELDPNTILMVEVGSTAHGTGRSGQEDHDETAVQVETPEQVLGLSEGLRNKMYRTQPEGTQSGPGDTDRQVYSLRSFLKLAASGNPSIMLVLWAPIEHTTHLGDFLRALGPKFIGRHMIARYRGYMQSQAMRLLGTKGGGHGVRGGGGRPELIEKYGYDTKYAMHVLRLAKQGFEFATTGRMTLPMPEADRLEVMRVRRGEFSLDDTLGLIRNAELRLEEANRSCTLPDQADKAAINEFMVQTYRSWWRNFGWNYDVRAPRLRSTVRLGGGRNKSISTVGFPLAASRQNLRSPCRTMS